MAIIILYLIIIGILAGFVVNLVCVIINLVKLVRAGMHMDKESAVKAGIMLFSHIAGTLICGYILNGIWFVSQQ